MSQQKPLNGVTPGVNGFRPNWPMPPGVDAWITERSGGVSAAPYGACGAPNGGFNLAQHVGDDVEAVANNRLQLGLAPVWLEQVHGVAVFDADTWDGRTVPVADASFAQVSGRVCAVLTADCLPVLLSDHAGTTVGVAHAGWRGLHAGVLEALVGRMRAAQPRGQWQAWLGPCIGPRQFEVGPEVRDAFLSQNAQAEACFHPGRGDRWRGDLPGLARLLLRAQGVMDIYGGDLCTVELPQRFFSYRREGVTGRFASLIWRTASVV